jgi:glycosyltransferase involved in cell wall biosynthesis
MNKRILYEPAGRIHSTQWRLINYPPAGYKFVLPSSSPGLSSILTQDFFWYDRRRMLESIVPLNLTYALYASYLGKRHSVDAIYSYNHLVFREIPWFAFVEWFHVLVGRKISHFKYYKNLVLRLLRNDYCRAILTWSELAKKAIIENYDDDKIQFKVHVVPLSVEPKNFNKKYDDTKVRLLFVGSPDSRTDFFHKGGLETIQAYSMVRKEFDNVELIVRANVPDYIRVKYSGLPNLRIINNVLPRSVLERLFMTADVFVQPTYDTPFGAFLDAMSYELPIVTRDAFANSEIVWNGKTGILIKDSGRIPLLYDFNYAKYVYYGATPLRRALEKLMSEGDEVAVNELAKALILLIERPNLRRLMGKRARLEVEKGKFSIDYRNNRLGRIFDESLS